MAKPQDIIQVATKELGTMEEPPNSNSVKYNRWFYGREECAPWCAVFVSYVFAKVDASLVKKTASCVNMADWFKAKGQWKKGNPQPGDVVFFKYNTNSRYTNHVGIVESVNSNGTINTIEGNTSFNTRGSQDNGGAVAARVRNTSNVVGYGVPEYEKPNVEYFRACDNKHTSIVDALKSIGAESSAQYRASISIVNGLQGQSAQVNVKMLSLLKSGKLLKP